jgi:hypothetical protein
MLEVDLGPLAGHIGLKDGGLAENNPSYCAYSEHASLHGDTAPGLLVSIGAGMPDTLMGGFDSVWPGPLGSSPLTKKYAEKFGVLKNLLINAVTGEDRHKMMRAIARGAHTWYKRFSVTEG